jgi:hypothetical protein
LEEQKELIKSVYKLPEKKYQSITDILRETQISQFYTDTIWISEPYRMFKSGVKSKARKMRLWGNKKGKSIGPDPPLSVVI